MSKDLQKQIDELTAGNTALAAKNTELLGEVKVFKAKAKGAEIDPEEHAKLQNELETAQSDLAKLQKDSAKTIEELTASRDAKDTALQGHLIDAGLSEAMVAAGVKADMMPAVKAMLTPTTSLTEKDGEYTALMAEKPLAEAVLEWAKTDAGKPFVSAPNNSGGGAAGGGKPADGGVKGDLGGDKAERTTALQNRFPELGKQDT